MMPSYVNIGAYVDEGTMVDRATVEVVLKLVKTYI
jgi:tetrahydrodipicolinate N-succinyltransferase